MRHLRSLILVPLVLATSLAPAQSDSGGAKDPATIMSGVFNSAQVARGRAGHRTNCGSCHGTEKYSGDAFASAWKGRTLFELVELIKTTMPDDNPGALPEQEYADIVAYILSINGYPAGEGELKYDDVLKAIKIDTIPARAPANLR